VVEREIATDLLRSWCDAPKRVREGVPALTEPAKLALLRELVASCNRLREIHVDFGVNHQTEGGITIDSWPYGRHVVGGPQYEDAVNVEFRPGVRVYDGEFYLEQTMGMTLLATSEEDARAQAYAQLNNDGGWEPVERPHLTLEKRVYDEEDSADAEAPTTAVSR
jgi:hypothetical protein